MTPKQMTVLVMIIALLLGILFGFSLGMFVASVSDWEYWGQ